MYMVLGDRFWNKVKKTDGCWEWLGAHSKFGHGRFRINGKLELPHRLVYQEAFGLIPAGMLICHHCDNPKCVNLLHLFLGSYSDNLRDAIHKGRKTVPDNRGENGGGAKLTWKQVGIIRAMIGHTHMKNIEIAKLFKISDRNLRDIIYNRSWKIG